MGWQCLPSLIWPCWPPPAPLPSLFPTILSLPSRESLCWEHVETIRIEGPVPKRQPLGGARWGGGWGAPGQATSPPQGAKGKVLACVDRPGLEERMDGTSAKLREAAAQ